MAVDMWGQRDGDAMTLRDAMDRLVEQAAVGWLAEDPRRSGEPGLSPFPVNAYEDAEAFHLWALLPGADPGTISVTATAEALVVEAEGGASAPAGWRPLLGEWRPGRWRRELALPGAVDTDKAEVACEHGVLRVRLPKPKAARARTIKITVRSG
jgi:HSP20 family protein